MFERGLLRVELVVLLLLWLDAVESKFFLSLLRGGMTLLLPKEISNPCELFVYFLAALLYSCFKSDLTIISFLANEILLLKKIVSLLSPD